MLLSLLEVLLSVRAGNEPMRSAFQRARDSGALDEVPGLVYARTDAAGRLEELVDTGIQRLLVDLDELPHPVLGYQLLEPPSAAPTLSPKPIPADRLRKHSRGGALVMTLGCRFRCPYCPIPAYNQHHCRGKSGERIADEIERIYNEYDIRLYFGTDDNFFADPSRAVDIAETLARKVGARLPASLQNPLGHGGDHPRHAEDEGPPRDGCARRASGPFGSAWKTSAASWSRRVKSEIEPLRRSIFSAVTVFFPFPCSCTTTPSHSALGRAIAGCSTRLAACARQGRCTCRS